MGSGWSKKVALAGCVLSFLGLLVQIAGSLLTVATPRDNQGAVGKGMVAIPTCFLVFLVAGLGVGLCWSAYPEAERKTIPLLGIIAGGLALFPWAFCLAFISR